MQDRPTAVELLEAAAEFLGREVLEVAGGAVRYKIRVAVNVLHIVAREIELGDRYLREEAEELAPLVGEPERRACGGPELRKEVLELNRLLAERIRAGEVDSGAERSRVLATLRKAAVRKLEIANPGYLETARRRRAADVRRDSS
ncbi:MAG TPA: DUF6285 domain-containing protein [Candidatus Binatia bacterium]|nr:DUF6285 domain-containing protein [Candidatus Binatia bacterium]